MLLHSFVCGNNALPCLRLFSLLESSFNSFTCISFIYFQKWIYKNLDFGVDLDTRVALVGPNGAGKSTLLKLISGEVCSDMYSMLYLFKSIYSVLKMVFDLYFLLARLSNLMLLKISIISLIFWI